MLKVYTKEERTILVDVAIHITCCLTAANKAAFSLAASDCLTASNIIGNSFCWLARVNMAGQSTFSVGKSPPKMAVLVICRNCVSVFVRVMFYSLFIVLFNAVSNKQRS